MTDYYRRMIYHQFIEVPWGPLLVLWLHYWAHCGFVCLMPRRQFAFLFVFVYLDVALSFRILEEEEKEEEEQYWAEKQLRDDLQVRVVL